MEKNSTAAAELAARLNSHGFGRFKVSGNRVIRRGLGDDVVLVAVSAGRGRPYEVTEALARAGIQVVQDRCLMVEWRRLGPG